MPMIHVPAIDGVTLELLRRRIIVLTAALDQENAAAACERLLLLDADKAEGITVHFSCTQADLDAAGSLAATIEMVRSETTFIAVGAVERAAVGVFAAADRRLAHPHATFVLSDPAAPAQEGDDIAAAAETHRRQLTALHERIAAASGRNVDAVAADMQAGRLLSATEAVDYGLVHSLTATHG